MDLLHKYDANKDGNLSVPTEVENLLQELGVALPTQTQKSFFAKNLDKRNVGRVSFEFMKLYFGEDSAIVMKGEALDMEPSK